MFLEIRVMPYTRLPNALTAAGLVLGIDTHPS